MRALVIQPAFLGDAIISLSLAEELRRLSPDSFIAYLVRPEAAPLIKLSPSVDKVFAYDKYGSESGIAGINKKADELNAEGFDTIFTLHSSKRTRMLIKKLNAGRKIGYGNYDELTISLKPETEQQTSRAIRLLLPLFTHANIETLPKLIAREANMPLEIKALPRPIITIAPESVWATKQWGIYKFKALIENLIRKNSSIILTGSAKENGLASIYKFNSPNILNLIAKTTLPELASIIAYSDLLISNDSAPIHIATATATKSVAIFGPTVSEFGFAPPVALGQVIELKNLWCRPCASHGSNECPIHTHECMTSISIEQVYESAIRALDRNATIGA
jgi:heptosyltransferase-2